MLTMLSEASDPGGRSLTKHLHHALMLGSLSGPHGGAYMCGDSVLWEVFHPEEGKAGAPWLVRKN